jgi:type IV secretion system protein VirB4
MYEGYFVITATYFPPVIAEQKFVELMFDDDREPPNNKQRTADLVERFKREITTFESRLSSAVKLTRLRAQGRK